jgi:hypothetical protein
MGADIYSIKFRDKNEKTKPLFEAAVIRRDAARTEAQRKAAQKRVTELYDEMYSEGYFRDSYNDSSLFWQLDLSWWRDVGDMLDDEGKLSTEKIERLKATVIKRKPLLDHATKDMTKADRDYFTTKYQTFLDFLDEAIATREPLECSV